MISTNHCCIRILQKLIEAQTKHDNLQEAVKEQEKGHVLMNDAQLEKSRKLVSGMQDECKKVSQHREALLDKLVSLGGRNWSFDLVSVPASASGNGKSEETFARGLRGMINSAMIDLETIKKRQLALSSTSAAVQDETSVVASTSSVANSTELPPTGSGPTPASTRKKRKLEETVVHSDSGVAPASSKGKARLRRLFKDFEEVRESVRDADNRVNEWSEDLYRLVDAKVKKLDQIKATADAKQKEREEEHRNALKELERVRADESNKVADVLKAAEGLDESFEQLEAEHKAYQARLDSVCAVVA